MALDQTQAYLLKALESFNRHAIVVSIDYKLLAAVGRDPKLRSANVVGQYCYSVLYNRSKPCDACPITESYETSQLPMRTSSSLMVDKYPEGCLYAYSVPAEDPPEIFVVFHFDASIFKGLENEMRRTNAFLQNLIRSASDPVIAADMKGRIIIFNDAATEASGYTEQEALNNLNIRDFYEGYGASEVMRRLRSHECGGKGKLKKFRTTAIAKDGSKIPISLYASIIYEGDKEVASIGFFHDLREEIHMRKKLEKTQIQLLQSEKMASLGKLAAGVAHQLNNPLGSIILYTKLVLEENHLDNAVVEDLNHILKDAERCRDTVRELLEFARQSRKFMKPLNINEAVDRCLILVEKQSLFQNITVIKQTTPDLPPVIGDSQQLNHMLMNIILNAAQAMEGKGTITIITAEAAAKDCIVVKIADTGPGIPQKHVKHIFEPFYTTKKEGQGTGLGLSMAFTIVENHGGTISAKNNSGAGTCFTIELPVTLKQTEGEEHEQRH